MLHWTTPILWRSTEETAYYAAVVERGAITAASTLRVLCLATPIFWGSTEEITSFLINDPYAFCLGWFAWEYASLFQCSKFKCYVFLYSAFSHHCILICCILHSAYLYSAFCINCYCGFLPTGSQLPYFRRHDWLPHGVRLLWHCLIDHTWFQTK